MGGEGLSILLVAESFFVRHYFSCLFEDRHTVRFAASGNEALEKAKKAKKAKKTEKTKMCLSDPKEGLRPFDLIFVNDYLPDMGMAELLKKISREQPEAKSFVLLTHSKDAKRYIEEYGVSGTITKPFTTRNILNMVKEALPEEKLSAAGNLFYRFP